MAANGPTLLLNLLKYDCMIMFVEIPEKDMSMAVYDQCRERATVKLMKLGHEWQGCKSQIPGLRNPHSLNGNGIMHTSLTSKTLSKNVRQDEYPI